MQETDGKPVRKKKGKFNLHEVAELVVEIEGLKPKFELLSRKGAAEYINTATGDAKNYTPKALANLACDGQGPPYLKLGNSAFYLKHDIDAWILGKRIVPGSFYHEKHRS